MEEKNKAAQELGSLGGKAGTGQSKVRGDSNYYSRIGKLKKKKKESEKSNTT